MPYYEITNPRYKPVRKLEPTDWNHADVFNDTLGQMTINTEALRCGTGRIKNIQISPGDWIDNSYEIRNEMIAEDSLCDVYFSQQSKEHAIDAEIDGATADGVLTLYCKNIPDDVIKIDCIEVRNEVIMDAG